MNKGYILIFALILALWMAGCEQTIIVHKDKGIGWYYIAGGNTYTPPQPDKVTAEIEPKGPTGHTETIIDNEDITFCKLVFLISADYPTMDITPDKILFRDKPSKTGDKVRPGPYTFRIEKAGYEPLQESGSIPVGQEGDYPIQRMMKCLPREVRFNIVDQNTNTKINPDRVLLKTQQIQDGDKVKPGEYSLQIHKQNYQSVVEDVYTISVGEGPIFISKKMIPAEVQLRFKFTDAESKTEIKADRIYLDQKLTSDGSYTKPGSHKLSVYKNGYKTLKGVDIEVPSSPSCLIEKELYRSTIKMQWKIVADYPPDMPMDPEAVLLDDKDVKEGDYIASGTHKVTIRQPAFQTWINDSLVVPDMVESYTLYAKLISEPRPIELAITHDVPPSVEQGRKLGSHQVNLRNLATDQSFTVESGSRVKPGRYELTIQRRAYNPITETINIMPGIKPYRISKQMEAKPRLINCDVSYDIEPPPELEAHVIDFIDLDTNHRRKVNVGGSIKPGKYNYAVSKAGYKMKDTSRQILIEPDETPYQIPQVSMEAEARKITFETTYNGVSVPTDGDILVNGKQYRFENIKPGEYKVSMNFKNYQPVDEKIVVPPGVGDYVAKIRMSPK